MTIKEWKEIEHSFFEIDEAGKIAKIVLRYEKPEDIFDQVCVTDTPLLSPDTLEHIQSVFALVPPEYKVDLTLRFDDPGPYSEEQLYNILKKNLTIELKSKRTTSRKRDKLAYCFMAAGVVSFLILSLIRSLWVSGSVLSNLVVYLFDIITMVSLYEAVTILSLERKEKLAVIKNLHDSFSAIHFEKTAEQPHESTLSESPEKPASGEGK